MYVVVKQYTDTAIRGSDLASVGVYRSFPTSLEGMLDDILAVLGDDFSIDDVNRPGMQYLNGHCLTVAPDICSATLELNTGGYIFWKIVPDKEDVF